MAQPCTTLGQTPPTAFPVCGTTVFTQSTVPLCETNDLIVPNCSDGADYANKNPFWYKFTCYVSGTLGFVITPLAANEDYDWQLWDITGRDPNDVFTVTSIIVTGNWAGTYGPTGASAAGSNIIECASSPSDNHNTFAQMPTLIAGHEYILLVSHFTDGQSGYNLSFGGGTAVITDPNLPRMQTAKASCDGTTITIKLNKNIRCNSLTTSGSDFTITGGPAITAAATTICASGFTFDELTLTLAAPLTNGTYDLVVKNGTDANTLLDVCGNSIPVGEKIPFTFNLPQPIFADSVAKVGCAPDSVKVYFPKKINCNTIAANGSDFTVTGPSAVTVNGAYGNCIDGKTETITVTFASPVVVKGTYQLNLKAGVDGSTVIDECGIELPIHSRPFTAVDTVSAEFTYTVDYDCRNNTLVFTHDGAHDVNSWNWIFNNTVTATTPSHTIKFLSASDNTIKLTVSNGVCEDSVTQNVKMDNEVKAGFNMPSVICPEDPLIVKDSSSGLIDTWRWTFDVIGSSTLENPDPVQFPITNIETYYTIRQVVTNNTLGCSDSLKKILRVLDNCYIAVPTGFTPNGDGLNDYLYPNNAVKAENLQFSVYNRWGQLVFSTRNWQEKWDGKIKGMPQASGVYVWFLRYTHRDTKKEMFQKGTTTLIR
jgi:gliding motility-associated-like protein